MTDETTTIEISVENWQWLSSLKQRPGDSFDDVLNRLRKQSRQEEERAFEAATERDTSEFLAGSADESEQATEEVGPEGMAMDAGEALFGDIQPADVPEDLDLPDSGDTYEQRRQAIVRLVAYLQNEGTATRADFLQLIDPDEVGYSSAESFWSNAVKGRDSLSAVKGVVPPSEGGHSWRYEPDQ